MVAYYNEIDPFCAAWLRELIKANLIAPGEVDERSIEDVFPNDLKGFTQCHFFAGIGVWSYALRCAGWPDDRSVWTGSCPCQPFSAAGKGAGFADERHLWPAFYHLISQCRPDVVFGEQVASKDGLAWFDLVQADMEGADYACGALDTCAAGFGAPHIRQRLYWVADAESTGPPHRGAGPVQPQPREGGNELYWVADAKGGDGRTGLRHSGQDGEWRHFAANGHWRNADWLHCRDGKWRPVVATHVALVGGSATGMVRVCPESAEQEKEEVAHERLHPLRQGVGPEALFKRCSGVSFDAGSQEVLQQGVHGGEHAKRNMFQFKSQQDESSVHSGQSLRDMRNDRRAPRPPCGRESEKQYPVELENVVSLLSPSLSLAELHGDRRTAEALRALRQAIYENRTLQHPSEPIEAVWASLSEEEKNRIRMGFDASRWRKLVSFPLENGAGNRVGRLRGYGNAIVAPQAQAFIEAYLGA